MQKFLCIKDLIFSWQPVQLKSVLGFTVGPVVPSSQSMSIHVMPLMDRHLMILIIIAVPAKNFPNLLNVMGCSAVCAAASSEGEELNA